IDIRIFGALADRSRADLEIDSILVGAVDQAVAVGDAGLESRRVASSQHHLAIVFTQHHFTGDHVDELILGGMPVALCGGGTGLQGGEIDTELVESGCVTQPLAYAPSHHLAERLWISGDRIRLEAIDIDLRHFEMLRFGYTRSTIVAVPMPMPMHRVTSAVP